MRKTISCNAIWRVLCGTVESEKRTIVYIEANYYEEPYAGKPHVRICEGLRLRGLSLLD